MSEIELTQSTDFLIKELQLTLADGVTSFDLSYVFDELNLYDNIFTPCVSGNIIISDAIGLSEKLLFQGNEKIKIRIEKTVEELNVLTYEKEMVIYKLSNKTNYNQTSQMYVLHFVSEEFILSEQKKITQNYVGLYSSFVKDILFTYLNVDDVSPSNGKAGIGLIFPSSGQQNIGIPFLSPFDAINWIAKRSISQTYNMPDFLFWETHKTGYNFIPLSGLYELPTKFSINFNPKNLQPGISDEFLGARSYKVLTQYDLVETIKNGSMAGKIIGFDVLTNTITTINVENIKDNKSLKLSAGEKVNISTDVKTKQNEAFNKMYDSRVTIIPFQSTRRNVEFIKTESPETVNFIDNIESYIFQRKAIFANFLQKRIQVSLPGNFGIYSGVAVDMKIPKYSLKEENAVEYDNNLSGKFIVTGTRHIIRYDKHETLIEVSTDRSGIGA